MTSVSVPVIADDTVEENESFTVSLSLSSSIDKGISIDDRNTVTVTITDSTSEYSNFYTITTS